MKIYVDGLFYAQSGIGRYYESLIKGMVESGMEVFTCVPRKFETKFMAEFQRFENIRTIFVDYEKFSSKAFIKQGGILKSLEPEVSVFLYPHMNLPLYIPKRTIVTIHDLIFLTESWDRAKLKRVIFSYLVKRALKYSARIIAISNSTANDILSKYPWVPSNKISVIHRFVDDKFLSVDKSCLEDRMGRPYLLFVGTRKKHKNLGTLVKAFNIVKDKIPHILVMVGQKDRNQAIDEIDELVEEYDLHNRVVSFTKVTDHELRSLYAHASLIIFPSLYEGFGLPPLEAVTLGCPAILSDIEVFKEIFGDSAIYFDPHDEEDIATKIFEVVSNEKLRLQLLKTEQERIKEFDKKSAINKHLSLLEEVASRQLSK